MGIDWAAWMVERVNGGINFEEYLEKNVWMPLGITTMTFHPKTKPATMERLADMSERAGGISPYGLAVDPEGKVEYTANTVWNLEANGISAGAGCYGNPIDYHRILHSILSDDGKLLKSATIDEMFKPQLSEAAQKSFMEKLAIPAMNQTMGALPAGTKVDHGLGGMILLEDSVERKKGSLAWGGYPNHLWFIDRTAGLSGIYGSQINPCGDLKSIELNSLWEKELYKNVKKGKL